MRSRVLAILGVLWCFCFDRTVSAEDSVLYGSYAKDLRPRSVFFVGWNPEVRKVRLFPAAFTLSERVLSVSSDVLHEPHDNLYACAVLERETAKAQKELQSFCSGTKAYAFSAGGQSEKKHLSEAITKLRGESHSLRQRLGEKEQALHEARESLGRIVQVDTIVQLRSKRLAEEEMFRTLRQEQETLNTSLKEILEVRSAENSDILTRSLQQSMALYQQELHGGRKKH